MNLDYQYLNLTTPLNQKAYRLWDNPYQGKLICKNMIFADKHNIVFG